MDCYTCETNEARWIVGKVACCDGCAAKYETELGIEAVLIPADEQIDAELSYLLAEIGTD